MKKTKRNYIMIYPDKSLIDQLKKLSVKENRALSNMTITLVVEALTMRLARK